MQLPAGLEYLDVRVVGSTSNCDVVDLQHLTALKQLCWSDYKRVVAELALPSRLTTLGAVDDVACNVPPRLTGGCGLRRLPVCVDTGDAGMRFLSSVPGLVGLSELRVFLQSNLDLSPYTAGRLAQAAAALGTATQLMHLALAATAVRGVPVVDWCGPLLRLPQLRSLVLFGVPVCQEGVLRLPSLTSLTDLFLDEVGLDDVAATVVCARMTNLRRLHVCGAFSSRVLMPAVANLTGLHRLYVNGGEGQGVQDRELLLLTTLSQLSYLNLRANACSDAGKQRLVGQLPALLEVFDCYDYQENWAYMPVWPVYRPPDQ